MVPVRYKEWSSAFISVCKLSARLTFYQDKLWHTHCMGWFKWFFLLWQGQSLLFGIIVSLLSQVPMNPTSGGHGHAPSPAVHGGSHHHSPAVQSHVPPVMSGHSHTAAPQASAQGQQQFQRLKVSQAILFWQILTVVKCQSFHAEEVSENKYTEIIRSFRKMCVFLAH